MNSIAFNEDQVKIRMTIDMPEICIYCDKQPRLYKVISTVNSYKVECDTCKISGGRFQLVEDAIDGWNNMPNTTAMAVRELMGDRD